MADFPIFSADNAIMRVRPCLWGCLNYLQFRIDLLARGQGPKRELYSNYWPLSVNALNSSVGHLNPGSNGIWCNSSYKTILYSHGRSAFDAARVLHAFKVASAYARIALRWAAVESAPHRWTTLLWHKLSNLLWWPCVECLHGGLCW